MQTLGQRLHQRQAVVQPHQRAGQIAGPSQGVAGKSAVIGLAVAAADAPQRLNAGIGVRDAIRSKEPAYLANGLDDAALSDDALLDAMVANPVLINRPFVFSPLGVRLCRPDSSQVLDILPPCDKPFVKEDGEVVIDERGNRVR